jgi:hypothetical protein
VFRAPANNLTAGVVEDDHPVLLRAELLEEEEVADLEVVGDGFLKKRRSPILRLCATANSGQPTSRTALPLTSLTLFSHWHPVVS